MKLVRDPAIIFSIILVLLVFLLAAYPIVLFYFSSYISRPKDLEAGGYIAYLGEEDILISKSTPLVFFYLLNISKTDKGYLLSISIFNYTEIAKQTMRYGASFGFPPGFIPRIDFSKLTPICNASIAITSANRSSVLRIILLVEKEETGLVRLKGGGVFKAYINESGSFTFSYPSYAPDPFLGYAKIYETKNATINSSLVDGSEGEAYLTYIKAASSYVLGSAIFRYGSLAILTKSNYNYTHFLIDSLYSDFETSCPYLAKTMESIRRGDYSINNELLFLYSLSFTPSDQAWWDAFVARFNALFPFNYILLSLSALLIIARMRKWL